MGNYRDISGIRFGKLVALNRVTGVSKSAWFCQCDCGGSKIVSLGNLTSGTTKSCGCIRGIKVVRHGLSRHPLYSVWNDMKQRCLNKRYKNYKGYGGRGIKVCDEWIGVQGFHDWAIANGYEKGLSIDRIDVNGNYEPSNCRWVDSATQGNNRRDNHYVIYHGEKYTLSEVCRMLDLNYPTIASRLKAGLSIDEAAEIPCAPDMRPSLKNVCDYDRVKNKKEE